MYECWVNRGYLQGKELQKRKVSKSSVHIICTSAVGHILKKTPRGGRKIKLSYRQERIIVRNVAKLRASEGGFSSRRLMQVSGLSCLNVSDRTVRRCLNRNGYHFLQARKKCLLLNKDFKKICQFAKDIWRICGTGLFTDQIAFFLDGTSFI